MSFYSCVGKTQDRYEIKIFYDSLFQEPKTSSAINSVVLRPAVTYTVARQDLKKKQLQSFGKNILERIFGPRQRT